MIIDPLIIFFILLPIAIIIHELGHALPIVLSTKSGEANIFLGSPDKEKKLSFSIAKVHFYLGWGFSGFCLISNYKEIPPFSNGQRFLVDAGGPLFSLISGTIAYELSISLLDTFQFVYYFAVVSFFLFFTSVVPITYPKFWGPLSGYLSDGLRMYQNVRDQFSKKTISK